MVDIGGIISFLVSFAIMACIYAIFCLGLNVQWGYTGLGNFGVAGFFAIGAYASALITTSKPTGPLADYVDQAIGLNQPFLVGVLGAAIFSGLLGLLIGLLTLRLRRGYLSICTIGIAESIRIFFNNEPWLANGPEGLVGLPRPLQGLVPPAYYHYLYLGIALVFLALIYFALEKGIRSPWGRVLRAVREDEIMADADGKDVFLFKLQSFVVGAVIIGIGGALYAHYSAAIQPGLFTPFYGTFIIWAMLTAGGTGNNKGAILGAFIIWALWQWSNYIVGKVVPAGLQTRAPFIRFILIGLVLVLILLKRPRGIIGEEKHVSKF